MCVMAVYTALFSMKYVQTTTYIFILFMCIICTSHNLPVGGAVSDAINRSQHDLSDFHLYLLTSLKSLTVTLTVLKL